MGLFGFGGGKSTELQCPFCKSRNVSTAESAGGSEQKYICYNCGKFFTIKK